MYQAEDYIVYGANGVCRITEICKSPFSPDDERMYYVMKPISDTGTSVIYTPVDNDKIMMRPLMTEREIQMLGERIPHLPLLEVEAEKQRRTVYRTVMATADAEMYVRLLKTVAFRRTSAREKRKRLPEMDYEYESLAKRCLSAEVSIVLGISEADAAAYLSDRISANAEELEPAKK